MLTNNFKKSLLALNVGLVLAGAGAVGTAVAADDAQAKEQVEVIEVRGIRRSLEAALNTKRFANSVVDAVSAEDVGKFPDSDVGEALGRIPGVAVGRQFGQGQQVSIRGTSAQLTSTLLNGHSVASTGWYDQQGIDRSFNYSLLPPELIGGIDVYKSSQANIVEGGIGGTVIVKTRKPLELDANTAFASVKADYGTISEDTDPSLSGLYSWKNDDENFGVLASLAYAETNYQRNGIESLVGWGDIAPTTFEQARERTAINFAFQYAPTENLELGLNLMTLDLEADNTNTSIFMMFPNDKTAACSAVNPEGTCVLYKRDGKDDLAAWAQTWARVASMSSDTADFTFKYQAEDFTVSGRFGSTKSEGGTDLTSNFGFWLGQPADYAGTYDMRGDVIAIDIAKNAWTAQDFQGKLSPAGWSLKKQPNTDEEQYAQVDFEIPVEAGIFTKIYTGARWADHEVKQETTPAILAANVAEYDATKYYSGTVSSGAGLTLPKAIHSVMIRDARAAIAGFDTTGTVYKAGYGTIKEENVSVYAMADFQTENARGNIGIRYVSTDASSDYYGFQANGEYANTLSTDSGDYNDVLPSVNIAYDLAENVILRFAASHAIARPNYADMFSASSLAGYNDDVAGNEVLKKGNIGLKPFKAEQFDLGIEYYFGDDGMFSATYFDKEISSFTTTEQKLNQGIGIVDPRSGVDNWTVASMVNGTGGEIKGVELQLQDGFENGYGYQINYTFADGTAPAENYPDRLPVFSDSSRHTVNLVGYYEAEDYSVRLAYNWRSEYMVREEPYFYGNREHQDFGSLDLSANYDVNEYLTVTFEAVNLTEEDSIQIGRAGQDSDVKPELRLGYPAWSFEGEARYKVGLNFRF